MAFDDLARLPEQWAVLPCDGNGTLPSTDTDKWYCGKRFRTLPESTASLGFHIPSTGFGDRLGTGLYQWLVHNDSFIVVVVGSSVSEARNWKLASTWRTITRHDEWSYVVTLTRWLNRLADAAGVQRATIVNLSCSACHSKTIDRSLYTRLVNYRRQRNNDDDPATPPLSALLQPHLVLIEFYMTDLVFLAGSNTVYSEAIVRDALSLSARTAVCFVNWYRMANYGGGPLPVTNLTIAEHYGIHAVNLIPVFLPPWMRDEAPFRPYDIFTGNDGQLDTRHPSPLGAHMIGLMIAQLLQTVFFQAFSRSGGGNSRGKSSSTVPLPDPLHDQLQGPAELLEIFGVSAYTGDDRVNVTMSAEFALHRDEKKRVSWKANVSSVSTEPSSPWWMATVRATAELEEPDRLRAVMLDYWSSNTDINLASLLVTVFLGSQQVNQTMVHPFAPEIPVPIMQLVRLELDAGGLHVQQPSPVSIKVSLLNNNNVNATSSICILKGFRLAHIK